MNITDVSIKNPVFAWMLMACTILFGIVARHAHRHQPVPRRRLSEHHRQRLVAGRVAARRSSARSSSRSSRRSRRSRACRRSTSHGAAGHRRASPRRSTCRATSTSRCRTCRRKVAQAQRSLPKDVPAATVSKSNPDDTPILTVGVSGPFSRQLLSDVARYQVQEKLQTVAGVGQITLNGYLDRNVRIWLDASRLAEKGVVANDVIGAIQQRARRGARRPARRRRPPAQRAPPRRGARPRRAASKLVVRQRRTTRPVYLEDVGARRGRLRGRRPRIARLDGVAAPGARRPQAARHQRRRRRHGGPRQGRRDPDAACPRG